jgi:predicted helicase
MLFSERNSSKSIGRGDIRGVLLAGGSWMKSGSGAHENLRELLSSIKLVTYRPFDDRYMPSHSRMIDWPREEVMQHLQGRNVALLVPRQLAAEGFQHSFCADKPCEMCVISTKTKEQNYVFPLWLHPADASARVENLAPDYRAFIDGQYQHHYTPEEIFGYVYAVLHAPTYRARYAEFLRIDFPRVPFPDSKAEFDALSKLGWALVQAHLLRQVPRRGLAQYHGQGEHVVEAVRYDPKDEAVWINKTQYFKPVPQAVWDFHIGGHQVLDKYLKSRKGRTLSLDEINHVAAVADVLAFTIEQMARIDEAYRAAFPERG